MISDYFEDEIIIVSKIADEWGTLTETPSAPIPARVEDYNKLVINKEAKEVKGEMLIIIEPNSNLKYEDFIKINKKGGVNYPIADKKFIIKKMSTCGGFEISHMEIII